MPQVASESGARLSEAKKSHANKMLPLVFISWVFPMKEGDWPSWRWSESFLAADGDRAIHNPLQVTLA